MTNVESTPETPVLHPVRGSDGLSDPSALPVPENAIRHFCGAWWTGRGAAHCGGCHRTFTSVSAFVAHRRKGECVDPESLGMVRADRQWIGWSLPGTWTPEDAA